MTTATPLTGRWQPIIGSKRERVAWILLGVFVAISFGLLVFTFTRSRQLSARTSPVVRYEIATPPKTALNLIRWPAIALSPDGSTIVFSAMTDGVNRLYARRRDDPVIKVINGTEGASGAAFSPDGKWIAFFANRNLIKTTVDGPVTSLLKVNDARGISWASDDSLIFSPDATEGLFRISADGSQLKAVTKVDASKNERTHRWPRSCRAAKQQYSQLARSILPIVTRRRTSTLLTSLQVNAISCFKVRAWPAT